MEEDQSTLKQKVMAMEEKATKNFDFSSAVAKELSERMWTEVFSCSIQQWPNGPSSTFGFDENVDYCIPQLTDDDDEVFMHNNQPYCTRGYQFKVENRNQNRKWNAPKIVTKCNRYMSPIYVPTVSVIGYQKRVAVLQVVFKNTKEIHFIAIDVKTGEEISVLKRNYQNVACLYEAYLSTDETVYLLRPNFYFAYASCTDPYQKYGLSKDIDIISIKMKESRCIHKLEDISPDGEWYSIAFHPSSGSSFVALGNHTLEKNRDNVALVELDQGKVVVRSPETASPVVSHHLVFNPQGTYLASLGLTYFQQDSTDQTSSIVATQFMKPLTVTFYNSENLSIVQIIARSEISMGHLHCGLTPLFNKAGTYMALLGDFGQSMSVYKMPTEMNLQSICRSVILDTWSAAAVGILPIPKRLKAYLSYELCW